MAFDYPIPRGVRQPDDAVADGTQTAFSVPFVLYDVRDIKVFVKPVAGVFALVDPSAYTVTIGVNSATVTFAVAPAAGSLVRRKGARVPYRTLGVVNNGVVQSGAIETEFSSIVVTLQELRRDVDQLLAGTP